ncbi:MAG: type II secretion system protein N, partial [Woeseiaceae bacterium]
MAVSKRLVAAGLATFLAGMIYMFPARIAYDWFAPPELRLTGISGSLWRGQATEGSAAGLHLRNVQWRFKALSLLTGKAAISLSSDTGSGFVNGDVSVSPTGTVTLQD